MAQLNPKGAVLLKVEEIYSIQPGPDAGKKNRMKNHLTIKKPCVIWRCGIKSQKCMKSLTAYDFRLNSPKKLQTL